MITARRRRATSSCGRAPRCARSTRGSTTRSRQDEQQRRQHHRERDRRDERRGERLGEDAALPPNDSSTNANSPTCASENANSQRAGAVELEQPRRARAARRASAPSTPTTSPRSCSGSLAIRPKSIGAPTEMKNRPSSRPLNGSMSRLELVAVLAVRRAPRRRGRCRAPATGRPAASAARSPTTSSSARRGERSRAGRSAR